MEVAWDNLAGVLAGGGMSLADLVKITAFVTVPASVGLFRTVRDRRLLGHAPACTYIEVSGLASPAFLIELEGEAVQELKQGARRMSDTQGKRRAARHRHDMRRLRQRRHPHRQACGSGGRREGGPERRARRRPYLRRHPPVLPKRSQRPATRPRHWPSCARPAVNRARTAIGIANQRSCITDRRLVHVLGVGSDLAVDDMDAPIRAGR